MTPELAKQTEAADAAMREAGETQPAESGKKDGRAVTSPQNGAKGGKAPADYAGAADAYKRKGGCAVIWRKEGFYEYSPATGAYRLQTEKEQGAKVAAFLRDGGGGDKLPYSVNAERNVVGALRAADDLSLVPPVFLSTGKSAAGWIAMKNCLLNVEAAARGEADSIREHSADFFSTFAMPYNWTPDAQCPKWEAFLDAAQPDEEGRVMLQMLAGLLLVPDTSYQAFFILYGEGGSGKSTYLTVIREMLGRENVCRVPLSDFADKFTVGLLTQKLANLVDDSPTADASGRASMNAVEGILKEITGGRATMKLEPKGVDADTSRLVLARCVFCQNPPLPPFADRSEGLWRRLRVIPFPRSFYGAAGQNPRLAEEIIAEELPGVFAWAVDGLAMLRTGNGGKPYTVFPQSAAGAAMIAEHRATCDRERTFLEERYAVRNGAFVPSGPMFASYRAWCMTEGYNPKNSGNFKQEVLRVFPQALAVNVRMDGKGTRGYRNLERIGGNEIEV